MQGTYGPKCVEPDARPYYSVSRKNGAVVEVDLIVEFFSETTQWQYVTTYAMSILILKFHKAVYVGILFM